MKLILRSLLVCFLLLALPFQAVASASMGPLVASPGTAAQASRAVPLPACHHEQARDHDGHAGHAGQHAKDKCGSCAACCVGAALACGVRAVPAPAPARFVSIPFRAGYLPSVDPVLPERPPSPLPA